MFGTKKEKVLRVHTMDGHDWTFDANLARVDEGPERTTITDQDGIYKFNNRNIVLIEQVTETE